MCSYAIGADGALYLDEKLHIHSLMRPDRETVHLLENTIFAIGDDKGKIRMLEEFSEIRCKQAFLGASYKLADKSFSAKITAWAVTPFGFGEDAHLPAAAFSFKIKNDSKKKRTYTFGVLVENFLNDAFHQKVETQYGCGVQLGSASMLSVQPGYMTHCVLMDAGAQVSRYIRRENKREAFLEAIASGSISDLEYTMPGNGDCGAVMQRFTLEAGESKLLRVVYAWYAPNMQFVQADGTGLMLKNAYTERFSGCVDIAGYVLTDWHRLIGFSRSGTGAVRTSVESKAFESAVFDNFRTVCDSAAYKLNEIGNARVFYKNNFGAPNVFARKALEGLFPATVYFDFDGEADELAWALEYCIEDNGCYHGVQSVADGLQFYTEATSASVHMSPIWRVYRLYLLSRDVVWVERFWGKLKQIIAYIGKAGWVTEGESVFSAPGADATLMTNFYILSLLCMEKMADLMGEAELAGDYGKLASEGKAFVKRNLFNGRFYVDKYPAEEDAEDCKTIEILPMLIGCELGLSVADAGQFTVALENIYVLNFSETQRGLKCNTADALVDNATEVMYAQALLQADKSYLASLVCKAQYVRESAPHENTAESLFVNALFGSAYKVNEGHLYIGKQGAICFVKDAVLLAEAEKTITVRVLGAPVHLTALTYLGKGMPGRVTYGDMELMYVREGETLCLNAPLMLSEGTELKIHTE